MYSYKQGKRAGMEKYTGIYIIMICQFACAVDISVDFSKGRIPISPYINGRNNNISDNSSSPTTDTMIKFYTEAGLRFTRDGGGNNATKYNWRRKLSSHPDWYNNVYSHNWDFAATTVQTRLPVVDALFSLQLLGKSANNNLHNFDDWAYNQSQWNANVSQNWAGGGGPTAGSGNPSLYLMDWPADSTAAILPHWFTPTAQGGLGLDSNRFRYWEMDNEPEVWNSTHDDVVTDTITAEAYLAKYFAVAKKARMLFPGIKIVGPVFTNEWQWWDWNNHFVGGLPWMEYFIKRVAEEQTASGLRLLDVVCFHFYPSFDTSAATRHIIAQLHRIWYDTSYQWPWANGSKGYPSGWDQTRKKQYIFGRVEAWLTKYIGANHGVKTGISEMGISGTGAVDGPLIAVTYASHIGTFADHSVALYIPWYWNYGQWEVLHLFSRYAKNTRVTAVSTLDSVVSAYASASAGNDSVTIVFVNRHESVTQNVNTTVASFTITPGNADVLELSGLPTNRETFISHTNNAIKKKTVTVTASGFSLNLPPLSVTAVLLRGTGSAGTLRRPIGYRPGEIRKQERKFNLEGEKIDKDQTGIHGSSGTYLIKNAIESRNHKKMIIK
jgi:hypothetical protein